VIGSLLTVQTVNHAASRIKNAAIPAGLKTTAINGVHAAGANYAPPRGVGPAAHRGHPIGGRTWRHLRHTRLALVFAFVVGRDRDRRLVPDPELAPFPPTTASPAPSRDSSLSNRSTSIRHSSADASLDTSLRYSTRTAFEANERRMGPTVTEAPRPRSRQRLRLRRGRVPRFRQADPGPRVDRPRDHVGRRYSGCRNGQMLVARRRRVEPDLTVEGHGQVRARAA